MTRLSPLTMIIVSHFLEKVKDGIHFITGKEMAFCPDCGQLMDQHSRCRRYVRRPSGQRDELSLRVFHCSQCHRYHRELPDFIMPYKHLCMEIIAAIYDVLENYAVEVSTIERIRLWVKEFIKFGSAMVGRSESECPTIVTKYDANSTLDTLRYFAKVTANAGKWKLTSSHSLSG